MTQQEHLDSIGRPWCYDPDVGAILASPRPGEGDGAYRYATDPATGRLVIESNPSPTPACVFQQRRDALLLLVAARVRAAALAASVASQSPGKEGEESDDSGESGESDESGGGGCSAIAPVAQPRQRRVTNTALMGCTITTHVRPTTGRTDLTVVTPDGRTFRSKAAALRYLEGA